MNKIKIRGARTHNLKNINLIIPRNKLIVITGLSGSGKSSLAFDTLYAEGQRRYIESISPYARQFLSIMEKPNVDHIEGLSPAISIEQKSISHNPRSTVGTITEIYDYLRLLFARIGTVFCPNHSIPLEAQTINQMVDYVLKCPKEEYIMLLAPLIKERKGEHYKIINSLLYQGYIRARIDGKLCELINPPKLELQKKHTIEVVVDIFQVDNVIKQHLLESFENAIKLSNGTAIITFIDINKNNINDSLELKNLIFSTNFACPICNYSIHDIEPRLFSFNNPIGACSACNGLGIQKNINPKSVISNDNLSLVEGAIKILDFSNNSKYFQMLFALAKHYKFDIDQPWNKLNFDIRNIILYGSGNEKIQFKYKNEDKKESLNFCVFKGFIYYIEKSYKENSYNKKKKNLNKFFNKKTCNTCYGSRLCREAVNIFLQEKTLPNVSNMSIDDVLVFFKNLKLSNKQNQIAEKIIKEINNRLKFLIDVGLGYLTLSRSAETLSSGESQRIRLASQIGSGLVGVMYVLDEPSIGLHQRDNNKLINTLLNLRDIGNTVILVEHDMNTICAADYIIDIGPGAGIHGGKIVAEGTLELIKKSSKSITGKYINGLFQIEIPKKRTEINFKKVIKLIGASGNNLKNIDLILPIGLFTCITGVSGSGKSTLINDTLFPIIKSRINGNINTIESLPFTSIKGVEYINKIVEINQNPIGRTPRSNPATYSGIFTIIRSIFADTLESRSRGYLPGRFSFNVKGGRCELCQGGGIIKVEMHFLPDVYITCDQCKGKRYNRETLEIKYKNKNINEILNMTMEEALTFFYAVPSLINKLKVMIDVGLNYIQLGQSATTLSGGEAQRLKLAKELSKFNTSNTLYILDEPTTGLHFADIKLLINIIYKLRNMGNTIVVIEHNMDVIKTSDWIIDLGPEGGIYGGEILASGTPEAISQCNNSYTAKFLKLMLCKT